MDEWIEYAPTFSVGAEFERAVAYANDYLELRTFLVGYDVSIADVVVWAALTGESSLSICFCLPRFRVTLSSPAVN